MHIVPSAAIQIVFEEVFMARLWAEWAEISMQCAWNASDIEVSAHSAQSRAMNTSSKTIWMAALGTRGTAVAAGAQENPPIGERTLSVLVYDYAGLSDSSMNEMESLSAVLLSRAGIRVQWVHCLGHPQGPRQVLCDAK